MTTLVDVATYRRLTGDTVSDDTAAGDALADAQQLVEEYLRRPLEHAERTERLRLYRYDSAGAGIGASWAVYPKATPIDVAATTGYTVEGAALVGISPDDGPWIVGSYEPGGYATVTYTGGWTVDTLPLTIAREISRTAKALTRPALSEVMANAGSVRVGDISASISSSSGTLDGISETRLRPYVRRRAS